MAFRLGVAQIHTRPGDLDGCVERICAQAEMAAAQGVDLLLFPLMTLMGPDPIAPMFQSEFYGAVAQALEALGDRLACPCLIPLPLEIGGVPVHNAVLIDHGSPRLLREPLSATDLSAPLMFPCGGMSFCVAFSYDAFDELLARGVRVADVLVCLSDREFSIDDPACALAASEEPLLGHPSAPGIWTVAVGSVGGYDGRVFLGASYVAAPDGGMVAAAPPLDEALLVAEVGEGADVTARAARMPYDVYHFLWQALVLGIRDHVAALELSDVAVVLDGTLAASALAVAASDALGPTHVHALVCTSGQTLQDGARFAESLRLTTHELHEDVFEPARAHDGLHAQASLVLLARDLGALALVSWDKTALAFAPQGLVATSGMFAPLADVLRSDLLAAAHVRNAISPVFPSLSLTDADVPLPRDIVPGLVDEALLGQVDDVIAAYLAGDLFLAAYVDEAISKAVLDSLHARTRLSQSQLPLLVMSSVTLDESRLPVGFGWRPSMQAAPPSELAAHSLERMAVWDQLDATDDGRKDEGQRPDARTVQSALRETLDLLRDLSMGDVGLRDAPFSEN